LNDTPAGHTGGRFVWYPAFMMLTFRTALLSEGEEVGRVIRAAFTPYVRALGREWPAEGSAGYAEAWERFVGELERGDVYVALDGEQIVGAVRTKPQENGLYIQQIAVDPSRQGTGVGSWLLERIDEVARSRGLAGLSLETAEMAEANIRLYRRHGFEIVGRGPPEHGLDPHTRVHMLKSFA
jgi:ribosomal protein S18 acetylase RimI-like enzyme